MGSSIDCWMQVRYESERLALLSIEAEKQIQLRLLPQLENKNGHRFS
jgi:hypothetical protein